VTAYVYKVTIAASAKRELLDLSTDAIGRVLPKIRELANDPRPPGCKKLRGSKGLWRVRVGDYRIVYAVNDPAKTVDITRIAHRRDAYD
jgi:mRNA interferase RelE/StbE